MFSCLSLEKGGHGRTRARFRRCQDPGPGEGQARPQGRFGYLAASRGVRPERRPGGAGGQDEEGGGAKGQSEGARLAVFCSAFREEKETHSFVGSVRWFLRRSKSREAWLPAPIPVDETHLFGGGEVDNAQSPRPLTRLHSHTPCYAACLPCTQECRNRGMDGV